MEGRKGGKLLSCVRLLVTPWTVAHQAPPSMGFSRLEDWSGVRSKAIIRDHPQTENRQHGSRSQGNVEKAVH